MNDSNVVKDTADAVAKLATAVPVYQDLAQPAAKEIGTALQTVARTVTVALTPLRLVVWGYDRIEEFVTKRVSEKLKDVPPERIVTPPANVAGPALEALRFAGEQPDLREMYANLLATSIDAATSATAHPAFVEILKQLNSDEARILKCLSNGKARPVVDLLVPSTPGELLVARNICLLDEEAQCKVPALVPSYLDNLNRLGLTEEPAMLRLAIEAEYTPLVEHPNVRAYIAALKQQHGVAPRVDYRMLRLTVFGAQFVNACVIDRAAATSPSVAPN